jgi:hypothetical protein
MFRITKINLVAKVRIESKNQMSPQGGIRLLAWPAVVTGGLVYPNMAGNLPGDPDVFPDQIADQSAAEIVPGSALRKIDLGAALLKHLQ